VYTLKRKYEGIPILSDYSVKPEKTFWDSFPKAEFPNKIVHSLNLNAIEKLLVELDGKLTMFEVNRAMRCIDNFKFGAPSYQKSPLPACVVENSKTTVKFGPEITDTVAHWTFKEFVAGPFDTPPVKNFRVNALKAIDQGEKIRPVLNVSLPIGRSFNDNINKKSMEKVYMSNAKKFGYSICDAGKNAVMSKYDLVDAYKNVPAPLEDLRLQGFCWLEKYFIETRQIFGAKTSVANFDVLGNTILTLAKAKTDIPSSLVHRTLDDVPVVAPPDKLWCEKFSECYEEICKDVGIKLAPECVKKEKAFKNSKVGKVLGIHFDTEDLKWSLPSDKKEKAIVCIKNVMQSKNITLLDFQVLMGRLNDITQMCPFMKGFKHPLNKILGQLETKKFEKLSHEAWKDLTIWLNFLCDTDIWLPIAVRYSSPPIGCISFCSDAAGWAKNSKNTQEVGCGNIGFDFSGRIIFAHQLMWPSEVLKLATDKVMKRIGDKTTTLEFIGVVLPFLMIPNMLVNSHVIVKVDNIGCFYGWLNRQVHNDEIASIFVRTLHMIEALLGCKIHIEHLPRKETWEATVVDRMSRMKTTTEWDICLLKSFSHAKVPKCLTDWMKKPVEDWDLPFKLLESVEDSLQNS